MSSSGELVRIHSAPRLCEPTNITNSDEMTATDESEATSSQLHFLKTLGNGTYGHVQLAHDKHHTQVAVKIIKKNKVQTATEQERINREITIGKKLKHPNIVEIIEVFDYPSKMMIVMDYAPYGELYDLLITNGALYEDVARDIFVQICNAVDFCHQNGVAHRDLKLENILVFDKFYNYGDTGETYYHIKLADFGLANTFNGKTDLLKTFCGSLLYAAPEVVYGQPYYGPNVDCWALGVVLYALVYGAMPFEHTNQSVLLKQITTGKFFRHEQKLEEAEDLIERLLTVSPKRRATIDDIFSHEWMTRQSFSLSGGEGERAEVKIDDGERDDCDEKVREEKQEFLFNMTYDTEPNDNSSSFVFKGGLDIVEDQIEITLEMDEQQQQQDRKSRRTSDISNTTSMDSGCKKDDSGSSEIGVLSPNNPFRTDLLKEGQNQSTSNIPALPPSPTSSHEMKKSQTSDFDDRSSIVTEDGGSLLTSVSPRSLSSSSSSSTSSSKVQTLVKLDKLTETMSSINHQVDSLVDRAMELHKSIDKCLQF